ncbi:MAG: DUF4124 domain-containing protein [Pseudomonadota bacterium]
MARIPIRPILLPLILLAASAARADMCKYVDSDGHVTYSNVPVRGAKKEKCFEPPQPSSGTTSRPKVVPQQQPDDFPSVDSETQKKRDDTRRKIIEDELLAEERSLEEARRALAEGEAVRLGDERNNYQKYLDRVQGLKDTVELHEKNISALKEELAGMK